MPEAPMEKRDGIVCTQGAFAVGCNYWASHAGTAMWSDWRPRVVEEDLAAIAGAGLGVLRVFPLWPDFQPITVLRGCQGAVREVRFGEEPLPDTEAGRAGLSEEALGKFAFLADCADRNGLRLVVALLTGWMSGRLFVPPALDGRDLLADPFCLAWEFRFARAFVSRFRSHPAVAAWDLGNECNCLAPAPRETACAWTAAVSSAIRSADPSRPVLSGMHGLSPEPSAAWTIGDQAEWTDALTTHPYPLFTPHCGQEPPATIRPVLHAAAESRFYADIGRKPCMVEETGALGPMMAGNATAAAALRSVLLTAWAHDCRGLLWWCAFDHDRLAHAPYDWCAVERELGLFRSDRTAKPVLAEMTRFAEFLRGLPFDRLPPAATEAVCIVGRGADPWGAAYAAFILAKQAGFDISFQDAAEPLRDAAFYLLPSAAGDPMDRRRWTELLERVRKGATLYVSLDTALLSPFGEPLGIEPVCRHARSGRAEIALDGVETAPRLAIDAPYRLELRPGAARVLGREPDGNPAFLTARVGKGLAHLLTVPLEKALSATPGAFGPGGPDAPWRLYRHMARPFLSARAVGKDDPRLSLTEHPAGRRRIVIAVNCSPDAVKAELRIGNGWRVSRWFRGRGTGGSAGRIAARIGGNDGIVFETAPRGRRCRA